MNDPAPINVVEDALSHITSLHRDKIRFSAFITAILRELQPLMETAEKMMLWRDIANAEGAPLMQIAEIVGAPQVFTDKLLYVFVGFEDQAYAMPMWDEINPLIMGGRWREADEIELTIDDIYEAQRVVIRAKILKNHSHGYTPEIQTALSMLFTADVVFVQNNHDMSFDLNIGALLSPVEVQLIRDFDILPRPAGVQIRDFMYWDGKKHVFGFEHQAGTFGFDDGYFALRIEVT